ncbi:conserved hypothetical protein [Leishmania mexicana MHOM/GT/2001/U1103]|uniref:Uncharacterized protein n=1 Tax=Leishmania mexicana (strain MHOM/GT/2001/U1103) TaxID=929439 RepID=E9AVT6_LEIMU|nr:conserved hypothetical protein [Leishmania mexicana MHOM/GT/2001/U1103]CBZ27069.1 conserved hypothetical protein [Leishmania mexicana MHOM/GT/2001/U1103]
MHKRSGVLRGVQSGISVGRLRLAEQFSTMEGWQRLQDQRFDQYVKEKRQKQYFDAFDQRVERAFRVAAKLHKAEVVNAFKRKVKGSSEGKWTAAVALEVKSAVEERLRWLRDVWSQIDADYRSSNAERQAKASREISDALRGEPGAYMQWVYERKREDRFAGPKEKAAREAELSAAELPEVTDDEANRYHSLSLRMADIEHNVKSRFGIAGQQHWAELQAAKDEAYEQKLDTAAKLYEKLLDQSARFDDSRRTALLRSNVERVHQAQVRFKASMEMEKERERLVEAHEAMREERKRQAKAERIAILQEAAELRRSGATAEEINQYARQRQLEAHARRQAEYQLQERDLLQQKKAHYLDMIEKFKDEVEMREGQEMLQKQEPGLRSQRSHGDAESSGAPKLNAFGFMDADRLDDPAASQLAASGATGHSATLQESSTDRAAATASAAAPGLSAAQRSRKKALWDVIEKDRYEDPFMTIHQARLDAAATYDPLYAKHLATTLAQGKKYTKQGFGELAAGGDMDRHVFKATGRTMRPYQWGLSSNVVHDVDGDGSNDYFLGLNCHVQNPETGDIDWRYEKKAGGAVFRGPLLYRMGAKREAGEPGSATMDPSTATVRRFSPLTTTSSKSASKAALPSPARQVGSTASPPAVRRSRASGSMNRRVTHSTSAVAAPSLPSWRSS